MKIIINLEKRHAYLIVGVLVLLSSILFVIGTAPLGVPTHEILYSDVIKTKTKAFVKVDEPLIVTNKFGIGTESPLQALHVIGNSNLMGRVGIGVEVGVSGEQLYVKRNDIGPIATFEGKSHSVTDTATRVRIRNSDATTNWFLSANKDNSFAISIGELGDKINVGQDGTSRFSGNVYAPAICVGNSPCKSSLSGSLSGLEYKYCGNVNGGTISTCYSQRDTYAPLGASVKDAYGNSFTLGAASNIYYVKCSPGKKVISGSCSSYGSSLFRSVPTENYDGWICAYSSGNIGQSLLVIICADAQ